jgi:hypothetical protein
MAYKSFGGKDLVLIVISDGLGWRDIGRIRSDRWNNAFRIKTFRWQIVVTEIRLCLYMRGFHGGFNGTIIRVDVVFETICVHGHTDGTVVESAQSEIDGRQFFYDAVWAVIVVQKLLR